MKKIILIFIALAFSVYLVSAVEIIDNPDQNPFLNNTNQTIPTNQTFQNITDDQIQKIISDYLKNTTGGANVNDRLVEELINLTKGNREEKQLLDALLKLSANNQHDFTEALRKMDYALQESNKQRDEAVTNLESFKDETKSRLETYETEAETNRLEIAKLKGMGLFYAVVGLIIGVLSIEVANFLKHNQKAYFVIRKIREKIPIKI